MQIYFFLDSRNVFGSFVMKIDASKEVVDKHRNRFKELSCKRKDMYYTAGEFQKYLNKKGISNKFLYDAQEIVWR